MSVFMELFFFLVKMYSICLLKWSCCLSICCTMLLFSCSSTSKSCEALVRCKKAFQALINIAIEELCEIGNSLIAPVRMGVTRPTAPFSLVSGNIEAVQVSIKLFWRSQDLLLFSHWSLEILKLYRFKVFCNIQ